MLDALLQKLRVRDIDEVGAGFPVIESDNRPALEQKLGQDGGRIRHHDVGEF